MFSGSLIQLDRIYENKVEFIIETKCNMERKNWEVDIKDEIKF